LTARPQATGGWGQGGPPASSSPSSTTVGSIAPTTSTNRSRVTAIPSLAAHPTNPGRIPPPAVSPALAGAALL
jgi:hypothetical protein